MSSGELHNFGTQFVQLDGRAPMPDRGQVALVPGGEVALLELELPKGLHGQAREQIARRQLLDRIGLGDDAVEMRPFQLTRVGGWTKVMVADAARMLEWRKDAGRKCKAILPEYLALPTCAGLWTMTQTLQGVSIRLGPEDGFGASKDIALELITKALNNDAPKPRVMLRIGDPVTQIEALLKSHSIPIATSADDLRGLDIEPPKTLGHGELSLDLRRDPQVARTRLRRQVLPWRWPILLGTIAAGLWGYAQNLETSRMSETTRSIQAETENLVKTHFVPSGPVLDVRTQVSRALAKQKQAASNWKTRASSLDLLARAGDVIALEQAVPEQLSATNSGEITVILRVADFTAADRIASALAANELAVEVIESRVSDRDSGVRTEIRLRDKGATQ